MSEFLRITTPIVNRNQNVNPQGRPQADPSVPFQMLDATKVQSLSQHKEILEQNQTILLKNEQPSIMANMLQDPQAVVHFLRTIYLVQEVVGMLPLMNNPLSEEIEELFNKMILTPEDIVGEMIKQEEGATLFKGELYDNLRNILSEMGKLDASQTMEPQTFWQRLFGLGDDVTFEDIKQLIASLFSKNESNSVLSSLNTDWAKDGTVGNYQAIAKYDISALLKAINSMSSREEILTSVGNNLNYLAKALAPQKILSEKLSHLSEWFKDPDDQFNFSELKRVVLDVLSEVEKSILYNSRLARNVSIVEYNLSRFADSDEALKQTIENMLKYFATEEDAVKFERMVFEQVVRMQESDIHSSKSQVLTTLSRLIEKEIENASLLNLSSDKIEKIVYSMLSSPTNFTPLLHFVIPVEYLDQKSFAEVWIDPDVEDESTKNKSKKGDNMQVLVAFDINDLGRFEAELRVQNNAMSAYIYVPKGLLETFKDLDQPIIQAVLRTKYNFEDVEIRELEKPRSLMDVFQSLPLRRSGVNVKV